MALDLEITPELRRAGLARDAIRLIQEARKNSGLDVADRIAVAGQSGPDYRSPDASSARHGGASSRPPQATRGRA